MPENLTQYRWITNTVPENLIQYRWITNTVPENLIQYRWITNTVPENLIQYRWITNTVPENLIQYRWITLKTLFSTGGSPTQCLKKQLCLQVTTYPLWIHLQACSLIANNGFHCVVPRLAGHAKIKNADCSHIATKISCASWKILLNMTFQREQHLTLHCTRREGLEWT